MSPPIDPQRFDGMCGLRVKTDAGVRGELDPEDEVTGQDGRRLAWDDKTYRDAREAFVRNEALLCGYRGSLNGIQSALDTPRQNKPDKKGVQRVLDGASGLREKASGPQRSDASMLMAWCEGILAQHYTTFIWNRVGPGQRAIEDLRRALAENPRNADAAFSLTATMLGIRKSGHQSLVEGRLRVDTARELAGLLPILKGRPNDLRLQSADALAMESLARDNRLDAAYASERPRVAQHIAAMRAADPAKAAEVDRALTKFQDSKR
jgi:hypothetical protein